MTLKVIAFVILLSSAIFGTAGSDRTDPLARLINDFVEQVTKALSPRESKPTLVLASALNFSNENNDAINTLLERAKSALQANGYQVINVTDEELKKGVQPVKGEESKVYLVRPIISESVRNFVLSAKISSFQENKFSQIVLSVTSKKNLSQAGALSHHGSRSLSFQESFRSDPLPFKILDHAIKRHPDSDKHSLVVLTASDLYFYELKDRKLIQKSKVPIPVDPAMISSRDPRGCVSLFSYMNTDYVVVSSHRSGGSFLLIEEEGALSFKKVSEKWFISPRSHDKALVLALQPVSGRNYFQPGVTLLDLELFLRYLASIRQKQVRETDTNKLGGLEGKLKPFYEVALVDQLQDPKSVLAISDLDGNLTFFNTAFREVNSYKGPNFGATFAAYFDPNTRSTYIITTSNNPADSNDYLTAYLVGDQKLVFLNRSSLYRGSITGLKIGNFLASDQLNVIGVSENQFGSEPESTLVFFNLVSQP